MKLKTNQLRFLSLPLLLLTALLLLPASSPAPVTNSTPAVLTPPNSGAGAGGNTSILASEAHIREMIGEVSDHRFAMVSALTDGSLGVPTFFRKVSSDGTNWVTLEPRGVANYYDSNANASMFIPAYLWHRSNAFVAYDAYSSGATNTAFRGLFGMARSSDHWHWTNVGPVLITNFQGHVLGGRFFTESNNVYFLFCSSGLTNGTWLTRATNSDLTKWDYPRKLAATFSADPYLYKVGPTNHLFGVNFGTGMIEHWTNLSIANAFVVRDTNLFNISENNATNQFSRVSIVQTGRTNWMIYASLPIGGIVETYVAYSGDYTLNAWTIPTRIHQDANFACSPFVWATTNAERTLLDVVRKSRRDYEGEKEYTYDLLKFGATGSLYCQTNYTPYGIIQFHRVEAFAYSTAGELQMDGHEFVFRYTTIATKGGPPFETILGGIQYISYRTIDTNEFWVTVEKDLTTRTNGTLGTAIKVTSGGDYNPTRWRVKEKIESVLAPNLGGGVFGETYDLKPLKP